MRATKGAAATTSGTMVALVPKALPTIRRVKGAMTSIRMTKGMDRPTLTIQPSTALNARMGRRPSLSVRISATPSGTPMR